MLLISIIVVLVFGMSLVSGRLEKTVLTPPMLFTAAGTVTSLVFTEMHETLGGVPTLLRIAEVGLVLLLFCDASRTDLKVLRSMRSLPARLLTTGMLLTIVLGAIAAKLMFPGLSFSQAGILAAILAPTDAGLGQVIVTSPRVPLKIRQALNVEAGLNDGLSVPFLLFFIAFEETGARNPDATLGGFIIQQLLVGALVGGAVGLAGGWLLERSARRGWMADSWRQLGVVALPLLALFASEATGASMFIAAFVAGLAVQAGAKDVGRHSTEFAEEWGQLFNLAVFFLFGIIVARNLSVFGVSLLVYAILSLTIVRMAPVALALRGAGLSRASVLFMGWFGPRGLASIVLGLVYLEEADTHAEPIVTGAVIVTVLISIFAHGLSAMPGMNLYAKRVAALGPRAPELDLAAGAASGPEGSAGT
jgi:NhaP-type Na+/H+ or K+/H+ antiporter